MNHLTASWAKLAGDIQSSQMKPQVWVPRHGESLRLNDIKPIKAERGFPSEKPFGGFWTSSLETYGSDWMAWLRSDMPEWLNTSNGFWLLTVSPSAKVFQVNGNSDRNELFARYGLPNEKAYGGDMAIDFAKFFEDYDGLHDTGRNLRFWDVESTCWARNVFSEVQHITSFAKAASRYHFEVPWALSKDHMMNGEYDGGWSVVEVEADSELDARLLALQIVYSRHQPSGGPFPASDATLLKLIERNQAAGR